MAPRRTTRSTADQETINATAQLQEMIDQGVTVALAARDALRSTNGDDSHNSGTGVRRTERAARECTYTDFLKCQPLPFKGTEGVASLSQWCERMEYTVGHEAAYGMSWKTLMKMMTDKYCPQNEIRKLERELWELKVKGTDLASYTQHFQELALLCGRMLSGESDKFEKYVEGLPDIIHGSRAKGNLRIHQDPLGTNNNNTRTKGRTLAEFTPQHLVERSNMGDPNPYALNAIITTTVHVLLSATTATKVVTLRVTVGLRQMPIMLTARGALGQDRNWDVMSVEFKDILGENVPS
uniref:Retrotransposon gag domain-containing protein n=2 Tax=Tanacetum cinerariifolium TaxID=118510 RepID=A0A699JHZ2_TANCI|nr:hypothetical protein [Tanacetum cinerariifolium]